MEIFDWIDFHFFQTKPWKSNFYIKGKVFFQDAFNKFIITNLLTNVIFSEYFLQADRIIILNEVNLPEIMKSKRIKFKFLNKLEQCNGRITYKVYVKRIQVLFYCVFGLVYKLFFLPIVINDLVFFNKNYLVF